MSENTIKTREELKETFVTGAKPTQQDFHDWLDAYVHKNDEQAGSGQSGQQQGGDAITPFEQFLMANNVSWESQSTYSRIVFNTNRNPVSINSYFSLTNNPSIGTYASRGIIFHRGRFYDTAKPGKPMHTMYAAFPLNLGSSHIEANLNGTIYYIYFDGVEASDERSVSFPTNWTGEDTEVALGDSGVKVRIQMSNPSSHNATMVVYDEGRGARSLNFQIYDNQSGTQSSIGLYLDENLTEAPQAEDWGEEDFEEGWPFPGVGSQTGNRLFVRLTEQLNPMSASLGYYQVECFLVQHPDADLEPGTYYEHDTANNTTILEPYIVEAPTTEA